jgi:hypothetical protein
MLTSVLLVVRPGKLPQDVQPLIVPVRVRTLLVALSNSFRNSGAYVPLPDGAPVTVRVSKISVSPVTVAVAPKGPVLISPPPVVLVNEIVAAPPGTAETRSNAAVQSVETDIIDFITRLFPLSFY